MITGVAMCGGLSGCAHAGVLAALCRHGVAPDIAAGCGAGAVVAAFYAAGCAPDQIIDAVHTLEAGSVRRLRLVSRRKAVVDCLRATFERQGASTAARLPGRLLVYACDAKARTRVLLSTDARLCEPSGLHDAPLWALLADASGVYGRRSRGDCSGAPLMQPLKMMGARRVAALVPEGSGCAGADVVLALPQGVSGRRAYEAGQAAVDAELLRICEGLYFKKR